MDFEPETEKLIDILFPDGISDDVRNSEEFGKYLNKLGSYDTQKLSKELVSLKEEKSSVINQLKEVACSNYKIFLETARASQDLSHEVFSVENTLRRLSSDLPKLKSKCEYFSEKFAEIRAEQKRNNSLLARSNEISKILEIPAIMLSCIQDSHYEEALALAFYTRGLVAKHSIPIIMDISKEVERNWRLLMKRLLEDLKGEISLPQCLQVAGFLRSMNVFSEIELRIKFLQCRSFWFDTSIADISDEDSTQYLISIIDKTRENLFIIVTQYKAVFSDDEIITSQNDMKNSIFLAWLNKKVNNIVIIIRRDLPQCAPNSLEYLFGQCAYFGQSFGRVGADFRGLMAPAIAEACEQNFQRCLKRAEMDFQNDMDRYALPKVRNDYASPYSSGTEDEKGEMADKGEGIGIEPPLALMGFYPLAEYCNAFIAAVNDLKLCAPLSSICAVTTAANSSLKCACHILKDYHGQEGNTWLETEREAFRVMCGVFKKSLAPFTQKCLHFVFPTEEVATNLGVGHSFLEERGIGFIDVEDVASPVREFLQ